MDLRERGHFNEEGLPIEPLHVALVDDDFVSRMLAEAKLKHFGIEDIEVFDNPHAVIERFQQEGTNPNFLVTDAQMPGINGWELARRIHEIAPDTTILMMSSNMPGEGIPTLPGLEEHGVNFFLSKSSTIEDLGTTLQNVRQLRQQRQIQPQ